MGYRLGYSGPEVDALLQKANETAIINNGWEKLASAESTPVDLNTLVTQGNYSMNFWKNGPDQLNTSGPINVCVTKDSSNNTTYQTIYDSGSIYTRETTTDTFSGGWVKNQNDTEIDIGDSAPSNPIDNYVWINTSGESPIIEIYKESINNWMAVSADDLAKASIYDPQGIKQPIDTYFDNKATEANLSAAETDYSHHINDTMYWIEGTISSTNRLWYSVCYGNDKFVAVASGTNYFAYSTDGINWTEGTISDTSRNWQSVCYGNDKYIAVTYNSNYFAYSTDGIHWTEGTISSTNRNWYSVCYGNDKFVTVAEYSNYFAYSTDGINWTESTISSTSRDWTSVCYGNGKYVTVTGQEGINFAYLIPNNNIHVTTDDKTTWAAGISKTDANTYLDTFKSDMSTYADEQINNTSAIADDLTAQINTLNTNITTHIADSSVHITEEDAARWDAKAPGDHTHNNDGTVTVSAENVVGLIPIERLDPSVLERNYTVNSYSEMKALTKNEIQNGDSVYINETHPTAWFVIDDTKLGEEEATSTEGTISSTSREWHSVCYGNGKFVTVAYNSNYFAYSTDGINWTEGTISSTSRRWQSVCYGNDKFVAVTYNSNYFAYSTDGINWTEGTISDTSRFWNSVCYGNDKFVTVTYSSNYFAYSTDGINWTEGTISSTNRDWRSVCYGNDKFVVVASKYFAYSTDGINWTEGTISDTSRWWYSVCYGNGKFVTVAYNSNYFAYSTDGINWTEGTISSTSRLWYSVCYGNNKFVAVASDSNYFAYSTDGINWIESTVSSTNRHWRSVCYGNDKFVAVSSSSNYFANIIFSPAGLIQYATPAKDLTWDNIENKPNTLAGYNITNCYTRDEIYSLYNTIITNLTNTKTRAENLSALVTTEIPSDLDTTISTNKQLSADINYKMNLLIKNAKFDSALTDSIVGLVNNA